MWAGATVVKEQYGRYRPSGVNCLGSIPAHWSVTPLKHIASIKYGLGEPPRQLDGGLPIIRATNVERGKINPNDMVTVDPDDVPYSRDPVLRMNDIIVVRSGAYTGDSAIIPAEYDGAISGYDMVVRVRTADPKFVSYCLLSTYVKSYQIDLCRLRAAQPHLNAEELGGCILTLPPLPEQQAIAAYLDQKTQAIDAVIRQKERLIVLLQEKRQTLITQAVTKGLHHDVPMKESRIDWLGEIPAHWAIAPVYARYRVQLGKMLDEKRITGDHLAPYLRNIDVQWDMINTTDLPVMDFTPVDRQRFALRKGDLLVCEGGEVGRSAIWTGAIDECYYQKAIHRLRPYGSEDDTRYLYYAMYTAAQIGVFIADGNPNTIDHLTAEKLRRHRFPFPPHSEQQDIAIFLDKQTQSISAVINKVDEHLTKLREYRQTLISAAVTGKIDVRAENATHIGCS